MLPCCLLNVCRCKEDKKNGRLSSSICDATPSSSPLADSMEISLDPTTTATTTDHHTAKNPTLDSEAGRNPNTLNKEEQEEEPISIRMIEVFTKHRTQTERMWIKVTEASQTEECPISMQLIAEETTEFLPQHLCFFFMDAPKLKKATLPCGHSFGILHIFLSWLVNSMQCPCCRRGFDELLSMECVPGHIIFHYAMNFFNKSKANRQIASSSSSGSHSASMHTEDNFVDNYYHQQQNVRFQVNQDTLLVLPWLKVTIYQGSSESSTLLEKYSMKCPLSFKAPDMEFVLESYFAEYLQEMLSEKLIFDAEIDAFHRRVEECKTLLLNESEIVDFEQHKKNAEMIHIEYCKIVVGGYCSDGSEVVLCDSGIFSMMEAPIDQNVVVFTGSGNHRCTIGIRRSADFPFPIQDISTSFQNTAYDQQTDTVKCV